MSYELAKINKDDIDNLTRLAMAVAGSSYFKDAGKAEQAFVKLLFGRELGLPASAAMTGIHIVEGKPELGGHLIAAAIRRSGKYDYEVEASNETACVIRFYRLDEKGKRIEPGREHTFTMDDAKRAQLGGKQNYTRYPKAMLFNRCISSGYKLHCPDVFLAPVYAEGEIGGRDLEPEVKDTPAEVKPARQLRAVAPGDASPSDVAAQRTIPPKVVTDPPEDVADMAEGVQSAARGRVVDAEVVPPASRGATPEAYAPQPAPAPGVARRAVRARGV